jgi:hypothetical protein
MRFCHGRFFVARDSCYTVTAATPLLKFSEQKILSIVSTLKIQKIVNTAATTVN